MKIFDYIYYRTYSWYIRHDDSIPHESSVIVVSLIQYLLILNLYLLISFVLPLIVLQNKWQGLILLIPIYFFNRFRYNKVITTTDLELQWKMEEITIKKKRGWLIVFTFFGLILFPVLWGILRHNLGIDF